MKLTFLLLNILIGANLCTYSQNNNTVITGASTAMGDFYMYNGMWNNFSSQNNGDKIKGVPFLFEKEHTNGVIYTKGDKSYKLRELNYNARLDQMVVIFSKDSIFSINPSNVAYVEIEDQTFERYLDPKLGRNSFYQVIGEVDGTKLLKRNIKEVKEGAINPLTHTKLSDDSYVLKSSYFVKSSKEDIIKEFTLRKKDVLGLFDDKAKMVKEYVKSKRLSYKDDSDLKLIFNYYNNL